MSLTTDEEAEVRSEIARMWAPGAARKRTLARWENVLRMWESGKTLEEIGHHIDRSPSTVSQLMKRGARERQKAPGYKWPTSTDGRMICAIPHPMPQTADYEKWHHISAGPLTPDSRKFYCPVCGCGCDNKTLFFR